jgi:metallo-beta-lactamase family protein
MKLTFLGATGTVTGSKYLVESGGMKLLVDCGLFQGLKELRLRNWEPFPVEPTSIDAVVLTHAHIDHTGSLPLLTKQGFRGKIYCSQATLDLCRILLPDSGKLQEEEATFANKKKYSKHQPALPLYTRADAERCLSHFVPIQMGSEFQLRDKFRGKLIPSGHILGAAFVVLDDGTTTLTFSGDLGRPNDLLIRPPKEIHSTDYLVIESTYGDREHPKTDLLEQLETIIKKTVNRGGTVVIPAFSVGRSQTLIYCLYLLKKQNRIPDIPIFLDSPMSIEATRIFCNHVGEHRLNQEQCAESSKLIHNVPENYFGKRNGDGRTRAPSLKAILTRGKKHHCSRWVSGGRNARIFFIEGR